MTALTAIPPLPSLAIAPTVRELAFNYACQCYDVDHEEIVSPAKHRHLVFARCLIVCIIRQHRPRVSSTVIGRWLHRDHSTVLYLARKAAALIQTDDEFRQECARFAVFLDAARNAALAKEPSQ